VKAAHGEACEGHRCVGACGSCLMVVWLVAVKMI